MSEGHLADLRAELRDYFTRNVKPQILDLLCSGISRVSLRQAALNSWYWRRF